MGRKNHGHHHHQHHKLLQYTIEIDPSIERAKEWRLGEAATLNRTGLKHAGFHGQMSSNTTLRWWTVFVRSYKYGQCAFAREGGRS